MFAQLLSGIIIGFIYYGRKLKKETVGEGGL
jgi:hypothetical protein